MRPTSYILEVNKDQVLFWAALLHKVLRDDPADILATKCLDTLMAQTECVSRDPKQHPLNNNHIQQMCQELYLSSNGGIPHLYSTEFMGDI